MAGRAASITAAALLLAAAGPQPGAAVHNGRIRMLLASRPAAGYFDLDNTGETPLVLDGAQSPACGMVMLHRSVNAGGTERMEMVPRVTVPPHGSVHFAPGGYHLMCMQPDAGMKAAGHVPMTLTFEGGGAVTTPFRVGGADVR